MRHLRLDGTIPRGTEALDHAGSWTPWCRGTETGRSSQCSSVWRSRDKPRSNLWIPLTTQAAVFSTRCSLLVVAFAVPARIALQSSTHDALNIRVWPLTPCRVKAEIAEVDETSRNWTRWWWRHEAQIGRQRS